MSNFWKSLFLAAVFLIGSGIYLLHAGALVLAPESRLWLEGDSSLHPFASTATAIAIEGEAASLEEALDGGKTVSIRVPVMGLKSGKSGLDQNMRKALKEDAHPEILFRLTNLSRTPEEGGNLLLTAEGVLTVAGEEKTAVLKMRAANLGKQLRVTGETPLRMTDFGIKPPSMMMGAVKTRDEVIVRFDLLIEVAP
jgi:hypothetical protein